MKTLQECKDEVAIKYGYEMWNDLQYSGLFTEKYTDEAAELYASQFKERIAELEEALKNERAITWEYNELKKANEWISVKDALPKPNVLVLCMRTYGAGNTDFVLTYWNERTNCFDNFLENTITHWKYINPPKV